MELKLIQDINRNLYLGIDVALTQEDSKGTSFESLLQLATKLIPNFEQLNQKLLARNDNQYHITVFNTMEFGKHEHLQALNGNLLKDSSITFKGIGSLSQDNMTTYFVVIDSAVLNNLRINENISQKDLHITIGFTHKDLFKGNKNNCNITQI